jgi:hypothetical protein
MGNAPARNRRRRDRRGGVAKQQWVRESRGIAEARMCSEVKSKVGEAVVCVAAANQVVSKHEGGTTARSRHAPVTPNEFEFEFEDEDEDESKPECAAVHVAAAAVRQIVSEHEGGIRRD